MYQLLTPAHNESVGIFLIELFDYLKENILVGVPEDSKIYVSFEPEEFQYAGLCSNVDRKEVLIQIRNDFKCYGRLADRLIHESVHAQQFLTRRLHKKVSWDYILWEGTVRCPLDMDYLDQPWEQEAFMIASSTLEKTDFLERFSAYK